MKTLSRTELERSLREGLRPLYLLLGSEVYLRRVAAQAITDAALSRTLLREFNEVSFQPRERSGAIGNRRRRPVADDVGHARRSHPRLRQTARS